MSGQVVAVYIAARAATEPQEAEAVTLEAGRGIVGDRYHARAGTFSAKLKDKGDWQATLIELEEVERFNASHGAALGAGSFRRNIVTSGVRLNDLVGRQFAIGDAVLEGVRLCEPCAHLGSFLGKQVVTGMAHRAGLRARILTGGTIQAGDVVIDRGAADE
jgi:MOSC domain-containing protein YiiM